MCRFVLYLGNEINVSALVTEPINSIIHQSFQSHEREEPLNGDGFGVGWYAPDISPEPAVFRSVTPAWNNTNLLNIARVTRSRCVVAHVRAATAGLPVTQLNCHPFAWDRFVFVHNGTVGGFHTIRRSILNRLNDQAFNMIEGSTDSEYVFALFAHHYQSEALADAPPLDRMEAALVAAIRDVEQCRVDAAVEEPSQLNLAVCDGQRAVVTRFTSGDPAHANSLYCHAGDRYECSDGRCRMVPAHAENRAVLVASEPLSNDPGWTRVDPNHLITIQDDLTVSTRPLTIETN